MSSRKTLRMPITENEKQLRNSFPQFSYNMRSKINDKLVILPITLQREVKTVVDNFETHVILSYKSCQRTTKYLFSPENVFVTINKIGLM